MRLFVALLMFVSPALAGQLTITLPDATEEAVLDGFLNAQNPDQTFPDLNLKRARTEEILREFLIEVAVQNEAQASIRAAEEQVDQAREQRRRELKGLGQ